MPEIYKYKLSDNKNRGAADKAWEEVETEMDCLHPLFGLMRCASAQDNSWKPSRLYRLVEDQFGVRPALL